MEIKSVEIITMKTELIYGVKVGPLVRVKITDMAIHPLNLKRKEPDPEAWMVFFQDIKKNGVHNPILLSADGKILQGQRRYTAAKKAGFTELPARYIEPNPEHTALLKIIYRDNGETRRNYTDTELEDIVLANWSRERVLQVLPRGVTVSKSSEKPLEKLLPEIAAITRSRAKKVLAGLRKRLKEEQGRKKNPDLIDGEIRYGTNRAREWIRYESKLEGARAKVHRIEIEEIAPSREKQKEIEKDLRHLGGLERFLKILKENE